MKKLSKNLYFDYASTTPVDKKALKAMLPYFSEKFGNSSSLHSFGHEAKKALDQSRKIIAKTLNAKPNEIIFTSSATESNNLALKGIAFANKKRGKHIIISSIEHPSIIETTKWLQGQGFKITQIPVDTYGEINLNKLQKTIKKDTILVSIMHANNEIGTIEPIQKIGKFLKAKNSKLKDKIYFHTDAAQSFGKIPIDVKKMNIDLLTASSHKIYGPKGAALLYIKEGTKIEPILHGGEHEFGVRSSTVNIPAIVGFAKAAEICQNEMEKEITRQIKLRDKLIKEILTTIPSSHLNGHSKNRLPNNINVRFDGIEGEALSMKLNELGIAISTASACASLNLEPSHVLINCGLRAEQSHSAIRITIGKFTRKKDIKYLIKSLQKAVGELRKISPFWKK